MANKFISRTVHENFDSFGNIVSRIDVIDKKKNQ